jgi:hypothetical protein
VIDLDLLKAMGWVLLAIGGLWFLLGNPIRDIKSFVDLWRGR